MRLLALAIRSLVRMRGAGIVAVLTLALGIGAMTTMASVAYATLYRQVPIPEADRVVVLYNTRVTPRDGLVRLRWSYPHLVELRQVLSSLEPLATFSSSILTVRGDGAPERTDGEIVSPEYFSLLRTPPLMGRAFTHDDAAQPVAMVGESYWRAHLAADPAVVGRTLRVNDVPVVIVGILPAGVTGLTGRANIWLPTWVAPQATYDEYLTTTQHFISAAARLKPGITMTEANAELAAVGARFNDVPARTDTTWSATGVSISAARIDPIARRSITTLFAAAACLLIVTCVNVASLILARAQGRRREMAIRLAIGASRAQLVRQLLAEGLALATVAGTAGVLLAAWGIHVVAAGSPTFVASWRNDYGAIGAFAEPTLDAGIVGFALIVTLGTALACSLVPALAASRPRLTTALRSGDRGATAHTRALSWLVVTEVALAVLLLSGAGMLADNFARLQDLRAGFATERVLTFWIRPPVSRYPPASGPATLAKFLAAVEAVSGVESAAVNRATPFEGGSRTTLRYADRPNDLERLPVVGRHYVSARYFETLGIPLRAGRGIMASDRGGAAPVTVINEAAARRFWPGEHPIGQFVWFGSTTGFTDPAHPVEIVGIVGDVKYDGVDQPIGPDFYTSFLQFAYPDSMFVVKTRSAGTSILPEVRAAVSAVDAAVPIYDVMTLDERVGRAMGRPKFTMTIFTLFGGAALVLAALGIYGLLSFTVTSELREVGVRLALGAGRGHVLRLFVGNGLRLTLTGVAVGMVSAIALDRFAHALIADLGTASIRSLAFVSAMMLVVAGIAAWLPARRASHIDPIVVLRND